MTSSAGDSRSVSADTFARLLERLHPEPDEAALEYERLRSRLVRFFDWRGIWPPDECADDVLDRLASKLDEIAVEDVAKYVFGIARFVALERRRAPVLASIDDHPRAALALAAPGEEASVLQDCFDRCLSELPDDSRSLILRYYERERAAKISNRRRLASLLGLTDNALRSRVQRVRERLERCVRTYTSQ